MRTNQLQWLGSAGFSVGVRRSSRAGSARRVLSAAFIAATTLLSGLGCGASTVRAAVAVFSNRTAADVRFTVVETATNQQPSQPRAFTALAGDITVVPLKRGEPARLTTDTGSYAIQADAAYYFGALPSGKVDLARIGVTDMPAEEAATAAASHPQPSTESDDAARTITVKIFVDDDEPSTAAVWEHRYRERIAAASDILDRTCGIKLKVIGTGTFHMAPAITDFDSAVAEFVRTVDPGEARLAIGFTGRYQQNPHGYMHMGGTHGPLAHHILVREWSRHFSESECLEFVLHEVGHFMGAVHSPESDAVMRAQLGDRQSRARRFQIHFDPLNALAMNLVAEEVRDRHSQSVAQFSPPDRARLIAIYREIAKVNPGDPAAAQYLEMLGGGAPRAISTGLR